jgi:HlyD family secretion protein
MSQDTATAPSTRRHSRRRLLLLAAIALVLIVSITLVAVSCTSNKGDNTPTVRVDRGAVQLAVSASGSITPSGKQNLGFADGGTVTQVMVNVGDRVQPGQLLARIDDTVARGTLAQRQATLNQQLATLDKLRGGNTVGQAQATLDQARAAEAATRKQVDATNTSNRTATSQARTQLRFDESTLDRAEDQLRADRSSCNASPRTTTPTTAAAAAVPAQTQPAQSQPAQPVPTQPAQTQPVPTQPVQTQPAQPVPTQPTQTRPVPTQPTPTQPTPTRPTQTQPAPMQPRIARTTNQWTSTSGTTTGTTTGITTTETSLPTVTARVVRLADSSPLGDLDDDLDDADGRTGAACSRLLSDRQAVEQAQGTVVSSRAAVQTAEQRERTDTAAGQVSLENARTSVVSAQNALETAGNDSPDDIRAQEAQVADARAAVRVAQQDVDQTTITAPVAGTITAINGTAGEVVSPPSAVTPLAPGGTSPLPVTSAGTGTDAGSGAPGSGAFVVLDAADPFQLVVPFEEADAARIAPGQLVDVSVDALPDDRITGRVTSVAPAGQDLSGIVSFYTTVVVEGGADRLRNGQTAEADVKVESVDNVLRVPTAAVRRDDGRPTVTVAGPDGTPVSMPFLAGLVGDDYVEVRSGLTQGDQVRLPQATVSAAPDQGGPPPGN